MEKRLETRSGGKTDGRVGGAWLGHRTYLPSNIWRLACGREIRFFPIPKIVSSKFGSFKKKKGIFCKRKLLTNAKKNLFGEILYLIVWKIQKWDDLISGLLRPLLVLPPHKLIIKAEPL